MQLRSTKFLLITIGISLLLILLINILVSHVHAVEHYYSLRVYPMLSNIPKELFDWIPFSVGDILYAIILFILVYQLLNVLIKLFKKKFRFAFNGLLRLISTILCLYLFFNISWAMNYYRIPVSKQLNLKVDTILLEDHLFVLDQHILQANSMRENLEMEQIKTINSHQKVEEIMRVDKDFSMLSKTQVKIKKSLIANAACYFGVSGYFNPLTHEAHINSAIPKAAYPFTIAHELTHQMGIGFEDECNFIAFAKLKDSKENWFRYSAYYQSVRYLLNSLYLVDKNLFTQYKDKLSILVKGDLLEEQKFWEGYTGWLTDISGLFYDHYLKHNNQAEGMARYGMVSRLIIAYEKKNQAN